MKCKKIRKESRALLSPAFPRLFFVGIFFITARAEAIISSREISVCAALLASTPRTQEHTLERTRDADPIEKVIRLLSSHLQEGPGVLPHSVKLAMLSMKNLSLREQLFMDDLLRMAGDYQREFNEHLKALDTIDLTTDFEGAARMREEWRQKLEPYADVALALPWQKRLRMLTAAILDFNRAGGFAQYSDPQLSDAFRIAEMINAASRATYLVQSNDPVLKRQLIKEHFITTYVMAIFQNNDGVGLYRDQIIRLFPQLVAIHPELDPHSPQSQAYHNNTLSVGSTKRAWEVYIPELDEMILEFLIFTPELQIP